MEELMTPHEKEEFSRQDEYLFNRMLSCASSCSLLCCYDEVCMSRFHRACQEGRCDLVAEFLDFSQDPDCQVPATGDSPLHLAMFHDRKELTELLLRSGADPNLRNEIGWTPLHALANRDDDDDGDGEDLTRMFFKWNAERGKKVEVDARDDLGRTPLECAVASLLPNVCDALLEHGADLTSFIFPTEVYFSKRLRKAAGESRMDFVLRVASGMMAVIERLKRRGYNAFDQKMALSILKLSGLCALFRVPPDPNERWYEDEQFQRVAKSMRITASNPQLTLYVLLLLRSDDAAKRVSYEEYSRLAKSRRFAELGEDCRTACAKHLCSKLARKFFLDWATACLIAVAPAAIQSQQLKLQICETMLKPLKNALLYYVCLAAERGILRELVSFEEMRIDQELLNSLFCKNKISQV